MNSKSSSISKLDQLIQKLGPINNLVDKIVSRITPKTNALAACTSGPGPGCTLLNTTWAWFCYANTSGVGNCGNNKCVYRKREAWVCNNVGCVKEIWGCTSKTCASAANCP